MAESKFCAGCLRDNEENEATSWCTDCGELVCKHCGRVHARFASPHKIIPLEQAKKLSSSVLNLSQTCEKHVKQKLILFCCQHDQIICASCVPEIHQNCKPIISIEDAAKGVRSSAAVDDLEKRLTNLSDVLNICVNENCDSDVDLQAKDIEKHISEIRKQINLHLDQIEDNLKREVESKRSECKQKASITKNELKMRIDKVRQWKKDIESLKVNGTEIHLFQAVKLLDIQTHKNETEVRIIQQAGSPSLKFCSSDNASKIKSIFPSFGTVHVVETSGQSHHLDLLKQGQQYLRTEKSNAIITKSCSFRSSTLGENVKIMSGCFAPGNKLLLCDHVGKCLYICKRDGSESRKQTFEYELTQVTMYDDNQALISMRLKGVMVLDMPSLSCGKHISTSGWWDVASAWGIIWLRVGGKDLQLIDINGQVINNIKTDMHIENICIGPASVNLYCSDGQNTVHVVTPDGLQRKFYESSDLVEAHGITADEKGNIYVAGRVSNNIHKISSDGRSAEVVLTADDGLDSPRDLAYNNSTKELLVINNQKSVLIYKIS